LPLERNAEHRSARFGSTFPRRAMLAAPNYVANGIDSALPFFIFKINLAA
jgi:hypothetical protein